MSIFKIEKDNLTDIKELKIDLEKDLQTITEKNLETIFGLKFISSEFSLQGFRIDTLSFDEEISAFVIIEYKKDRSFSVVDQGFSYLSLMLNNKDSFILEYARKFKIDIDKIKIDWSQSRVIFLANSFTTYQQNAINFKDLPIELWEVKKHDNQTILYNQLRATDGKESIKTISKNKIIANVSREVKKYSIEDHFKPGWDNSRDLFEQIRVKIFELDSRIEEKVNKYYIGFKMPVLKWNVCVIHPYMSKIELNLIRVDKEDLKDPEGKIIKIPWQERGWGKSCNYIVTNQNDIDYALFLVKQVYDKFYK
jgi:predicted transport protein